MIKKNVSNDLGLQGSAGVAPVVLNLPPSYRQVVGCIAREPFRWKNPPVVSTGRVDPQGRYGHSC
jgi:hypothetical protein